jgi:hypothetical protein
MNEARLQKVLENLGHLLNIRRREDDEVRQY